MKHLVIIFLFSLLLLMGCGSPYPSARLQPVVARPVVPEIKMQQRYYSRNDSLYLLLRFEDVRQVMDPRQAVKLINARVRAGASERDALLQTDSVDVAHSGRADGEGLVVRLAVPAQLVQAPNVLHLQLWVALAAGERMGTRFKLPLQANMLEKHFLLTRAATGMPLFQDYAATTTPLLLQSFGDTLNKVEIQRFDADFTPALPPMSVRQEAVPRALTALEKLSVATGDTFRMMTPGLYLFAPASKYERGVLVQPGDFPQITMAKELLPPLIYLTTSAERQALEREADTKAAVDRFWLKVGGDKNTARDLIRTYYSRVEMANKLYTSHKAGWATDRGMIYIIYGQPSDISHTGNTETWIYRQSETSPYVKFVFTKKENTFTANHYELVRRPEYEESWYSTVAKWRAGITDNM
ncbi:GWxTD domain-containing protein [Pontibacter chitinilyticus]|uniref:GWxTD domain-containing protein n=1 Tax=Pontibacter chitinilyticus TaxID=2674989 RepID=UPI00321A65CD